MAKRLTSEEVTSSRVASAVTKVLRDSRTSKASKTAAGSALTQRPVRPRVKGADFISRSSPDTSSKY